MCPSYTIGVWVGPPDGTPNPGFFGANVAAPAWAPECAAAYHAEEGIKIVGLNDGEIIQRASGKERPKARLEIRGSQQEVNWMGNGCVLARKAATASQVLDFPEAGRYDITAFDNHGRYDRISFSLQAPQ